MLRCLMWYVHQVNVTKNKFEIITFCWDFQALTTIIHISAMALSNHDRNLNSKEHI